MSEKAEIKKDNPFRVDLGPYRQEIQLLMPEIDNPGEDSYTGSTDLFFDIQEPTSFLEVNSKGITINSVSVDFQGVDVSVLEQVKDEEHEIVRFELDREVVGETTLHLNFERKFNSPTHMRGLHQSTYKLEDGTDRTMVTTQFEPTSAREAWPCVDDLAHKAIFQLTVTVPSDRTVLSNTPIEEEMLLDNDLKYVKFQETCMQSTHILALIVGDFEYREAVSKGGIPVRVYVTPGKLDKTEFALDVGVKSLDFLDDYFDFSYSNMLPKIDIVAIPDFEAGAMENYGLTTYREVLVLIDVNNSSIPAFRRSCNVIAHEIIHMWFGNLVTPEWFDNLWLKESFATYVASKVTESLFPEWDSMEDFVAGATARGKGTVSLRTAPALYNPVENPVEVEQGYDIPYTFGAAMLRKINAWLGEDDFRDGIRVYLKRHAFGNASEKDLWQAWEDVSGKPVVEVMDGWIMQAGMPVVHVTETEAGLVLRQERFFVDRDPDNHEEDETLWNIPLTFRDSEDTVHFLVFSEREMLLKDKTVKDVFLNPDQAGLYRVHYEQDALGVLAKQVKSKNLSVFDRYGLLSDAYALWRSEWISLEDYLEFLGAYKEEDNYHIWSEAVGSLGAIADFYVDDSCINKFENWAHDFLLPITEKVGWVPQENESHNEKLLRAVVLGGSVRFNNQEVIAEAKRQFEVADKSFSNIDPNLRTLVLRANAKFGDSATFVKFLELYNYADDSKNNILPEMQLKYLFALGNFRDEMLLRTALAFAFSGNVRSQNAMYVSNGVSLKMEKVGWDFFKEFWPLINARFGETGMIGSFVGGAISNIPSEEYADEVEEFFEKNPVPFATVMIEQRLEVIRSRAKFLNRNRNSLFELFS